MEEEVTERGCYKNPKPFCSFLQLLLAAEIQLDNTHCVTLGINC